MLYNKLYIKLVILITVNGRGAHLGKCFLDEGFNVEKSEVVHVVELQRTFSVNVAAEWQVMF